MKKTVRWIQGIANFINVLTCIAMGIEVHTHIDPDKITAEASVMLACLAVNLACSLYRLYAEKKA